MYTNKDWKRDVIFSARPGEEVEESIYWHMYNCMPPYALPQFDGIAEYSDGFMVSEAYGIHKETCQLTYPAYGRKGSGSSARYYFIGNMTMSGNLEKE